MLPKLNEINPTEENPFQECKLGRAQYAEILTNVIENYDTGFVLALNNKWGTGKTTFVKMWEKHLEKDGYTTVYYNAWEHDHNKEPLVSVLSELKKLLPKNEELFQELIQKGAKLFTSSIPIIGKALMKKYIGSGIASEIVEKTLESAEKLFQNEVDEYYQKREHLSNFKEALTAFIRETSNKKPLVFFIDELDRCRPDYAVEVLEHVKHFFSIKEIVFVLSIDKVQLGYGVQGYYGSGNINADAYLKRFIDLEYSLPEPSVEDFCNYLMGELGINKFLAHSSRNNNDFGNDHGDFLHTATYIGEKQNLTLRDIEKLFVQTGIVLKSFRINQYVIPRLFFFLIYAKSYHSEFYRKLSILEYSHQQLIDEYEKIIELMISEFSYTNVHPLAHIEALLLIYYNNSLFRDQISEFYTKDENGKYISSFKSRFFNHQLGALFHQISNNYNSGDLSISFFIEKINLTQPFID